MGNYNFEEEFKRPMKKTEAVYQYTSKCCNAKATKDPCVKSGDTNHPASLGTWRCTTCRQKCKVNREKAPK